MNKIDIIMEQLNVLFYFDFFFGGGGGLEMLQIIIDICKEID